MTLKARLLISLILAIFVLAVAVPLLPVYGSKIQFGFSLLWLSFCLLVIAANLHALLRLGGGEVVQRPALSREQREAIKRIYRGKARRQFLR